MINLDERYLEYLHTDKKFSIDGTNESVINYGWHCDGNEIKGYYLTTENHKLYYNNNQVYQYKEPLKEKINV